MAASSSRVNKLDNLTSLALTDIRHSCPPPSLRPLGNAYVWKVSSTRKTYDSSFISVFPSLFESQHDRRSSARLCRSSLSATCCTKLFATKSLAEAILEESSAELERTLHLFKGKDFRFGVIPAATPEECLAAACLRAQLFYKYPEFSPAETCGPSLMAELQRAHESASLQSLETRIMSEFSRDSKMALLGMKVTCLLAVCERSDHESLLHSLPAASENRDFGRIVSEPPAVLWDNGGGRQSSMLAVGTLDIHVGPSLPGENLQGTCPSGDRAGLQRGYIFNLCVSTVARRRGVASAMMETAVSMALTMGLKVLYIHVAMDNPSASALYESMGYIVEQEEDVAVEQRLNRCRRRLMKLIIDP